MYIHNVHMILSFRCKLHAHTCVFSFPSSSFSSFLAATIIFPPAPCPRLSFSLPLRFPHIFYRHTLTVSSREHDSNKRTGTSTVFKSMMAPV